MILGYNTNGFAFHRLEDALRIIARIGYSAVGITLDHHVLNPFSPSHESEADRVAQLLAQLKLRCVIETGARFLLDPWRKHQPTLVSPSKTERQHRIDFLCRAIRLAGRLGADAVSLWSGSPIDDAGEAELEARLVDSLQPVLDEAQRQAVPLALEPEPGMLLDTVAAAERLLDRLDHPSLGLTVDIGHVHCQAEGDIPTLLRRVAGLLRNLHIEDMRREVHDHLMFGAGEIDFAPILHALREIGYANGVYVELSRHSHDAVDIASQAFAYLRDRAEAG